MNWQTLLLIPVLCAVGIHASDSSSDLTPPCVSAPFIYTIAGCDSSLVDGEKIFLWSYHQNLQQEWLDSAQVENHSFLLKGTVPCEQDVVFAYKGTKFDSADQITGHPFVIEAGDLKMVSKGGGMYEVVGSPTNDSIRSYILHQSKYSVEEISQHPPVMALWLLASENQELTKPEIETVLDQLPSSYAEHPSVRGWRTELAVVKADVGLPYAEIVGITVEGDSLSLSEIVNKPQNRYVLIDFGAGWCGGCRYSAREFADAYADLRAKGVEVFGVSYDTSHHSWVKFIEEFGMKWPQVNFGFDVAPRQTQAWNDYRLWGIPATFLIECSTGMIIAKNIEEVEELYDLISKHNS